MNAGMHSYGMGDSPIVKWMIVVALVEVVFLVVCGVAFRDRKRIVEARDRWEKQGGTNPSGGIGPRPHLAGGAQSLARTARGARTSKAVLMFADVLSPR